MMKKYVMYVDVRNVKPEKMAAFMSDYKKRCTKFFGRGRALLVPVHERPSVQTLEFDDHIIQND